MSDIRDVLGPDLIAALEDLVDERIAAALAERENGSEPSCWLSIEEAAVHLRVSPSTIARLLRDGRCTRRTLADAGSSSAMTSTMDAALGAFDTSGTRA